MPYSQWHRQNRQNDRGGLLHKAASFFIALWQQAQTAHRSRRSNIISTWNGTIIDGHNRYKICKAHRIENIQTKEMDFSSRDEAILWILTHQLGRRNLTDFQRNEVALKYESVIAKRMKEKQREAGGDKISEKVNTAVDQMIHSGQDKTTKRKELSKIAGTSEGSIQRTKLILEKGTPEQIQRAREGGVAAAGLLPDTPKGLSTRHKALFYA